jgi:membrane protein
VARFVSAWWKFEQADRDSPWRILLRTLRAAHHHRATGHAAEMAFFAVLTLVPSTIAVGAATGASAHLFGPQVVGQGEDAFVGAVRTLMGPQLTDEVIAPFVHAQLAQANGGVALGSLLVAWWLSSHLFEATGHALDTCYDVADGRPTIVERLLALAFALVSVVLVSVTVEMMVVGPLGSPSSGPVHWLGLGDEYTVVWSVVRWPTLLAIVVGFLLCLYRFAPNVRHTWRHCLPGALFGAALWIGAAVGFRLSAPLGLRGSAFLANHDPAVTLIGESVNAVVSTVLWAYMASIAILLGGEFNAVLRSRRAMRAVRAAAESPDREPAPPEPVQASGA